MLLEVFDLVDQAQESGLRELAMRRHKFFRPKARWVGVAFFIVHTFAADRTITTDAIILLLSGLRALGMSRFPAIYSLSSQRT